MIVQNQLINDVLNQLAIELDIPPHKYKQAMERFDAIKRHLEDGDYPDSTPPPNIYLQGSFRLGTVIRPVKDGKEPGFDIDIVCDVNRDKENDNPLRLKDDVGAEVKAYAEQNSMNQPENGKRCWALNYSPDSEGIGFHVDILPSLPDGEAGGMISQLNLSEGATDWQYTQTTISLTNRDETVTPPGHDWRSSNPIGYARWFNDICQPGFLHVDNLQQKTRLFETYGKRQNFPYYRAADIPNDLLRTPLQRAIQIMKRHRDIRFSGYRNDKHKPISMIITTLAARLYEGRASQLQTTESALKYIIETLAEHAALADDRTTARVLNEDIASMRLIQRVGDRWYIPNPVNPHFPGDPDYKGENFADRWHEDNHARVKAFFQWVTWLRADFDVLLNSDDLDGLKNTLTDAFGESIATRTISRLEEGGTSVVAGATSATLSRFDVPHRERPTWPIRSIHEVTINGRATRQGWRTLVSTNGFQKIAKHYSLRFEVKTDVPWPYEVYWQAVNTGTEAESHGPAALRGQIIAGSSHHKESTLYTGFHWIECFIVKDGIQVARSGEFIVSIQ
jgi:adenylyl/guanylyl cyclase-like protein with sensor domain/cyclic GMP-AMP synthase DncV-like protein